MILVIITAFECLAKSAVARMEYGESCDKAKAYVIISAISRVPHGLRILDGEVWRDYISSQILFQQRINRLQTSIDPQLGIDIFGMRLNGTQRHTKIFGNFLTGCTRDNMARH